MKKKLYLLTAILSTTAVLFFSSCLKDNSHYLNFNPGTTYVDFPLGGFVNYGADAITEAPDTDVNGSITRQFAVNVASANLPTTPTVVKLAIGTQADVDVLNGLQANVTYTLMPSNAYVFTTTTVTIPAGKQYVITSITFYKNLLDPSLSYALPIKIVSGTGAKLTANLNVHYFHFIGNDFAGVYEHFWDRWSTPDSTIAANEDHIHVDAGPVVISPVSPTEMTVTTAYYTAPPYDITFVKTGSGATATYSNFQVDFTPDVIAADFTPGGVVLAHHPEIRPMNNTAANNNLYDPTKQYTYAQALQLFRFYYTTKTRAVIDYYVHP